MKILYIMSSYNLYGGTPKKTLDLMKHFGDHAVLYIYRNSYPELKEQFKATGGAVYEGFFGWNLFSHLKKLLTIIDNEKIDIVQTQFSMGETLGFLIKIFRPKVKFVVAFVASLKPSKIKGYVVGNLYSKVDFFIYISHYVKTEKIRQFPIITKKKGKIIYNGTVERSDNGTEAIAFKKFSILDIAGLIHLKNIQILIEALNIIINVRQRTDVFLYVAGDGPMRKELESLIVSYNLQKHIFLLGYQSNVGRLLNNCDVFVHPSYAEGFGIVIPEAMLAEKPIIVSNAGALPELIEDEVSGLVVEPHKALEWADAILRLAEDKAFSAQIAYNSKIKAENDFSFERFTSNYEKLYYSLLIKNNVETK